jgi:hypothetical protein
MDVIAHSKLADLEVLAEDAPQITVSEEHRSGAASPDEHRLLAEVQRIGRAPRVIAVSGGRAAQPNCVLKPVYRAAVSAQATFPQEILDAGQDAVDSFSLHKAAALTGGRPSPC